MLTSADYCNIVTGVKSPEKAMFEQTNTRYYAKERVMRSKERVARFPCHIGDRQLYIILCRSRVQISGTW